MALGVLRGEDLDALSRELGVAAGPVAQWHEQFLAGAEGTEMAGKAAYEHRAVSKSGADGDERH